jgi:hypothetical protein
MPVMSSAQACLRPAQVLSLSAMTGGSGKSGDPRRAERLKAALRDNLKRRKAQERARAQTAVEVPPAVRPRESGDPGAKKS